MKSKLQTLITLLMRGKIFEIASLISNRYFPQWLIYSGKSYFVSFDGEKININRKSKHVEIQLARLSALPEIIECTDSSHRDEYTETLFHEFFHDGNFCYLMKYKNQVVGYLWIFHKQYILTYDDYQRSNIEICYDEKTAFLGNLYINPDFRLKGLFPLLMSSIVERQNKEFSKTRFIGNIDVSNELSLKSHTRLGFSKITTFYYIYILGLNILKVKYPEGGKKYILSFKKPQLSV